MRELNEMKGSRAFTTAGFTGGAPGLAASHFRGIVRNRGAAFGAEVFARAEVVGAGGAKAVGEAAVAGEEEEFEGGQEGEEQENRPEGRGEDRVEGIGAGFDDVVGGVVFKTKPVPPRLAGVSEEQPERGGWIGAVAEVE